MPVIFSPYSSYNVQVSKTGAQQRYPSDMFEPATISNVFVEYGRGFRYITLGNREVIMKSVGMQGHLEAYLYDMFIPGCIRHWEEAEVFDAGHALDSIVSAVFDQIEDELDKADGLFHRMINDGSSVPRWLARWPMFTKNPVKEAFVDVVREGYNRYTWDVHPDFVLELTHALMNRYVKGEAEGNDDRYIQLIQSLVSSEDAVGEGYRIYLKSVIRSAQWSAEQFDEFVRGFGPLYQHYQTLIEKHKGGAIENAQRMAAYSLESRIRQELQALTASQNHKPPYTIELSSFIDPHQLAQEEKELIDFILPSPSDGTHEHPIAQLFASLYFVLYDETVQTAMTKERRRMLQHLSCPDGVLPYMDDVMRYRCRLSPQDFVFVP